MRNDQNNELFTQLFELHGKINERRHDSIGESDSVQTTIPSRTKGIEEVNTIVSRGLADIYGTINQKCGRQTFPANSSDITVIQSASTNIM